MEHGLLAQVVADHVGDVGVDALVVRDAGARGVGERHVPQPVRLHQPRDAEQGVGAEDERVEEVVVDPPVDDVDAAQAGGGARVDGAAVHDQVAALDQVGSELAGEEHVLIEGRVVDAGRQQRDGRIGTALGRELLKRRPQQAAVLLDPPDAGAPVEAAEALLDRLAVRDHVGDARGNAQVVLQHEEALVGADDVGPADGDPGTARGRHAAHLQAVLRAAAHDVHGDDAVLQDPARAVDVPQEEVDRLQALRQARLQVLPVGARDHARDAVDRDDALVGLVVPVDREGDALGREHPGHALLDEADFLGRELAQRLVDLPAVLSVRAVREQHLVVERGIQIVVVEVHRASSPSAPAGGCGAQSRSSDSRRAGDRVSGTMPADTGRSTHRPVGSGDTRSGPSLSPPPPP